MATSTVLANRGSFVRPILNFWLAGL